MFSGALRNHKRKLRVIEPHLVISRGEKKKLNGPELTEKRKRRATHC